VREISQRDHGIRKNCEIGARAGAFDGIGGVGVAHIEVSCGGRCQMAPRGKAPNTDPIGLNAQRPRARSYGADGAMRVIDHGRVMIFRAQAVLQNERRDTEAV
jgi:hypothetical protein